MSYIPPIRIVSDQIETDFVDNVYKVVLEQGIAVDKDELMRALMYDRGQYEAGYADGIRAGEKNIVHCRECRHKYFKDMAAYCPHKVGLCVPDFFCGYGERRDET